MEKLMLSNEFEILYESYKHKEKRGNRFINGGKQLTTPKSLKKSKSPKLNKQSPKQNPLRQSFSSKKPGSALPGMASDIDTLIKLLLRCR